MTLPRYNFTVQDLAGNVLPFANIEVRREVPGQPLVQLYADRAGAVPVGNPFPADANGQGFFHAPSGEYQIRTYLGALDRTLRYVQVGPPAIQSTFGPETPIAGASYLVGVTERFLTIKRAGPTLTEITLPAVAARDGVPIAYADWSTAIVADHEIRFVAAGLETVMKQPTYSVWSNAAGLARGWIYPAPDLAGWVVT